MATRAVIHSSIIAPVTPQEWEPQGAVKGVKIADTKPRRLLPVGPAYLAHARRILNHKSFAEDDADEEAKAGFSGEDGNGGPIEDDLGVGEEEENADLLLLDPKDWKNQDHYRVLGLSRLRIRATPDQIRVAHRKKVLKHHPDKKAGSGDTNDDALFKCIQKAYEVLSHPDRRRQFDSVDPYFLNIESDPPTSSSINTPDSFFELMGPWFDMEARFTKNPPHVPLGGPDATKEEVEAFYDYWYNFDSWRSFEYRDKEVNEGSEARDDKRYTEKKNKNQRDKLKKEDTARLRGIVDLTLQHDPRIKRIKQEEKAAREAKKAAAASGAKGKGKPGQPSKAELAKKEEEERLKKEEEDRKKAEAKKAKAAAANAAKKARRAERAAAGASAS